jgi:hypothetical protein
VSDEIPVEPEIESGTGPSDTAPSEEADRGAGSGGDARGSSSDASVTAGAGLGDDVPAPPLSEDEDEIPPTPEEAELRDLPLAERERIKLERMTPEQKARYDGASAEIMSHPAVAAFRTEEDRRFAAKQATQAAFLAAYRKKMKEKA